jgi:hypothetical protein
MMYLGQSHDISQRSCFLGVVMSELDTSQIPYVDKKDPRGKPFPDAYVISKVLRGSFRPSFRPECPSWIQALAMQCMANDPSERPTASGIAASLHEHMLRARHHP